MIFPGASPGTNPPWSDFLSSIAFRACTPRTRELQWAGERAYNRWLSEFCLDTPGRRIGLALLPLHDMDATIAEIHWAKEHGLNGVVLPDFNYDLPEYVRGKYWDPMFAACQEVGFALNFHGGNGLPVLGGHMALLRVEYPFFMRRPLWQLIFGGVFDRFPGIHMAFTEAEALWIPKTLAELDLVWKDFSAAQGKEALSMQDNELPERPPSDYWPTNGFVGVSLVKLAEMEQRHSIGVETMMYGVDYPHPEGTWGRGITWMQAALGKAGVPEDEARGMLGLNATRCYGLDVDALMPVVERIGPTIDEVLPRPSDDEVAALLATADEEGFAKAARHYESKFQP